MVPLTWEISSSQTHRAGSRMGVAGAGGGEGLLVGGDQVVAKQRSSVRTVEPAANKAYIVR